MDNKDLISTAKFFCIDLSGAESRYEIISKFKESKMFFIFEYLTLEEKKEFYCYVQNNRCRNEFLKSLDFDEMISLIKRDINLFCSFDFQSILKIFDNDEDRYNFIITFKEQFKSFSDYIIAEAISKFEDESYIVKLLGEFKLSSYYFWGIVKLLSDKAKLSIYDTLDISDKVVVIKSFKDINLKKEYALKSEFSNYRCELVASVDDEEFVMDIFNSVSSMKFRLNLIDKVENENLKVKLINLIDNVDCKDFLLTNYVDDYKREACEDELLFTKISNDITIGVELETCNKFINYYNKIHKIFKEFNCKRDSSVKSGFEITSPILHFNLEDMSKLKSVCELLKSKGFYTDKSCGGHIHIGASYFTSKDDYLMLLYLYSNVEDILYYITDRENTLKRNSVNKYAIKSKNNYLNAIDKGVFSDEDFTYENIGDMFDEVNSSRYNGLNFKNVGCSEQNTIEFRMPNGEIEFKELILNIKLFSRLIEVSHELVVSDDLHIKYLAMHLSDFISDKEKLNVFLDLLFDSEEEKEFYRRRYFSNKELEKINLSKLLNIFKNELFRDDSNTIVYNEDKHTLVRKK